MNYNWLTALSHFRGKSHVRRVGTSFDAVKSPAYTIDWQVSHDNRLAGSCQSKYMYVVFLLGDWASFLAMERSGKYKL